MYSSYLNRDTEYRGMYRVIFRFTDGGPLRGLTNASTKVRSSEDANAKIRLDLSYDLEGVVEG